jgi:DNA-binding response OmpR family regulator
VERIVNAERILVADDEPALLDGLRYALSHEGFQVETAATGEAALERALHASFDVIILDVMLPGVSGFDVCRRIREVSDVPIIMLTARDAEADRVRGLDLGADDYVTKPFSLRELASRVRSILRRRALDATAAADAHMLRAGRLEVDLLSGRVTYDGTEIALTPSEYELVVVLAQTPDQAVSRRAIVQRLWSSEFVGDERVCDVHVHAVRRKITAAGGDPYVIATVRGQGYALRTSPTAAIAR